MTSTVEFEDRTPENLKIAPLSDRAFRLWFNATCYCHRNLTDGRVPAILITRLSRTATSRIVEELLAADLLERMDEKTYLVHDYLDHNPSRIQVEDARRGNRERTRRWRDHHRDGVSNALPDEGVPRHSRVPRVGVPAAAPEKRSSSTSETERATEKTLLVVDRLSAQILKRDPQADIDPRSDRWLRAARLLLTTDRRSPEQVAAVLDWLPTDEFWSTVVLSMPKLRQQFTQLVAKMQAAQNGGGRGGRQSPSELLARLAASEARP